MNPCTRLHCVLQFQGDAFSGLQRQASHILTVQHSLEDALARITGLQRVVVEAAGRTDKGVHATGMSVHFDVPQTSTSPLKRARHSYDHPGTMLLALNRHFREIQLPIRAVFIRRVNRDFHARTSAIARTYIYRIVHAQQRPALFEHNRAYCITQKLDIDAMKSAAQSLIGEHDFTSFCSAKDKNIHRIRTIFQLDIEEAGSLFYLPGEDPGRLCIVKIKGSAFLYHQVRYMIAALVSIGMGKNQVNWTQKLLEQKTHGLIKAAAPPWGLYFHCAHYDDEDDDDNEQ